jgi:hypothetical protein
MIKNKLIKSSCLLILFIIPLIIFALTGADCNKVVSGGNENIKPVLGTWKLYKQSGALCDVCPNETVQFFLDGAVWNTCPGAAVVMSRFNVLYGQIVYVDGGPTYNFTIGTDSVGNKNLEMDGVNVSRHLWYKFISSNDNNPPANQNGNKCPDCVNSSIFNKK